LLEERRWVEVVEVVELVLVDDLLLLVGILTLNKLTGPACKKISGRQKNCKKNEINMLLCLH